MAKKFEHGEPVYLPVIITNTEPDHGYDYRVSFNDFVDNAQCSVAVGESQIKTAEEIKGDWESKYHEAEAEIATLKEVLERNRNRASKDAIALEDYRYVFKWMPEWREYILHEMCEQWRALEE
jgi:hypothetical protein